MTRGIEQLNNITTEYEEYDIDTYFDVMDISEEQKEKRKEVADDLIWVFLLIFAIIKTSIEDGDLEYGFIFETLRDSFRDVVYRYVEPSDYINAYIDRFTQNVMNTTWDNMNFALDDYWLSDLRAFGLGLDEANSIMNHNELQEAIEAGYTHKTWKAELIRTRKDHVEMHNTTIPILDYFVFPDCEMIAPHDEVNGTARQNANCRCCLKFEKKN